MDSDTNNPFDGLDPEYKTYDKNLDAQLKNYLKWEKNECNSELVKGLAIKKDLTSLRKMLGGRLEMNGGSIRGDMIPGFNGINDLVIIQTGQGLIKYLEEADIDKLKATGIVIGYDGRYNSRRYAEVIATIFVNQNYPVKLFSKEVITPFVSFAITKYDCVAGVMIGGGACPKSYNGVKIFSSNGCQIIPPIDLNIESQILDHLEPMEHCWNTDILEFAPMLSDPYEEVLESYLNLVSESVLDEYKAVASKSTLKFVYTPLHGISYEVFKKVVDNHCLMVEPVSSQITPDPKFPTVKKPNPEDPKALDKAKSLADRYKIKYVIGTDPDGCRMVFAQKKDDGLSWKTFDGNELGALFGWWALDQYTITVQPETLKNVYMIASTVSSKILKSMAREEKFNFIETLPGFRWIANKAYDLKQQNKDVIFGFEDAYGFMFSNELFDKDGIQASIQIMTMVCYLDSIELTLENKLEEIYTKYGFHLHHEGYFNADSYEIIEKIFEQLRNYKDNPPEKPKGVCNCSPEAYKPFNKKKECCCNPYPPSSNIKTYPKSIGMGKFEITRIRDITIGFDNNEPNRRSVLPVQPDMQMITFEFVNGIVATLRTNPKEAKLRYCAELIVKPEDMSLTDGTRLVNEVLHKMIHDFVNPNKNGLSKPYD